MSNLAEQKKYYTYEEYLAIEYDGKRYEYIDGEIYAMAMPSVAHGDISGALFLKLGIFLVGKPCKVYQSSLDVKLNVLDKTINVIPDVFVVCDKSKLDNGKRVNGAPDFIIEVLSFSNIKIVEHDTKIKLRWYRLAGVKEYWIVNSMLKTVTVYILKDGKYGLGTVYGEDDIIPVHTLEGCEINLSEVFHDIIIEEDVINQNIINALRASGVNLSDEQIEKAVKILETGEEK